ncbi:hypothetical protein BH10CYA1_BH10CYA1_46240 [soil metagenome]
MIGNWQVFKVWTFLLCCGFSILSANCQPTKKQQLTLITHLEGDKIDLGTVLKPMVSLVNVSGKPLELKYMKPSIVVPEIWDATTNKRVLSAPTYVYDQICTPQKTTLAPNEELDLFSMPILIAKQPLPSVRTNNLQAFWATLPGNFILKYSVPINSFLPGSAGQLRAKEIRITVSDPSKKSSSN